MYMSLTFCPGQYYELFHVLEPVSETVKKSAVFIHTVQTGDILKKERKHIKCLFNMHQSTVTIYVKLIES